MCSWTSILCCNATKRARITRRLSMPTYIRMCVCMYAVYMYIYMCILLRDMHVHDCVVAVDHYMPCLPSKPC